MTRVRMAHEEASKVLSEAAYNGGNWCAFCHRYVRPSGGRLKDCPAIERRDLLYCDEPDRWAACIEVVDE